MQPWPGALKAVANDDFHGRAPLWTLPSAVDCLGPDGVLEIESLERNV